ncbi:MAG TPA: D-aminoacylase [Methylomirabilota bacterium]|nr:D-aminoacylase [Methylomirabilota bacterium]
MSLRPLFVGLIACSALGADYDLVVRNGRVIDGTGNPARFADVAVKDGRIVLVGRVTGSTTSEVDAKGFIVAPGFIDVHTHAEDIDDLPRGDNFLRMGVTTLVLGNCGGSVTNVGNFFQRIEKAQVSPNVATLIGHGTVRGRAMGGDFDRVPTAEELEQMAQMVEQAMQDGALGLSTGLIYLPGTFAKTEEIIALAEIAAKHGGIYASHMRNEGADIFPALDELFRISREGGLRAHVSHIKLSGQSNWGQTEKVIAVIERERAAGLDITQDQYAYPASSTSIATLIPKKYREGGKFSAHYTNAATHAQMASEMKSQRERGGASDYSYAVIASYRPDRSCNGLNIAQAAKKLRGSDSLEDQIETILEIQKNGGASGVFHSMNEQDVQQFMQHPNTMFASDSGVRRFNEGVPHPRGYGNNARILARYVRELRVIRLEDAIRRMTSLPATTFGLKDRGFVREGCWADLVVFDPATVQDNATFTEPHQYATGFGGVFVNGVAVVKDDQHTGAKPGQPVRRGF